jgi:deoxyribodipyrimidine photolyase
MSPKTKKAVTVICFLLAAIGFLNFGTNLALHDILGGEAHHVVDGHYFLWSRYSIYHRPADTRNSRLTEVSSFTYYWMLWQSRSLMVTHPLAIIGMYLLIRPELIKLKEKKAAEVSRQGARGGHQSAIAKLRTWFVRFCDRI